MLFVVGSLKASRTSTKRLDWQVHQRKQNPILVPNTQSSLLGCWLHFTVYPWIRFQRKLNQNKMHAYFIYKIQPQYPQPSATNCILLSIMNPLYWKWKLKSLLYINVMVCYDLYTVLTVFDTRYIVKVHCEKVYIDCFVVLGFSWCCHCTSSTCKSSCCLWNANHELFGAYWNSNQQFNYLLESHVVECSHETKHQKRIYRNVS